MTPLQLIAMAATGRNGVLMVMTAGVQSQLSGFDSTAATYGSLDPAVFKGESCVRIRYGAASETVSVRFDTTGLAQGFFSRLSITGAGWDEVFLSANADAFDNNDGGRTTWTFNISHAAFQNSELYNCRFR